MFTNVLSFTLGCVTGYIYRDAKEDPNVQAAAQDLKDAVIDLKVAAKNAAENLKETVEDDIESTPEPGDEPTPPAA